MLAGLGAAAAITPAAAADVQDPTITAEVLGYRDGAYVGPTAYGWYPGFATVTFTCTEGSAPLTEPCPQPVELDNGADQTVTRTITAADGGTATVTISGIDVDGLTPLPALHRVRNGYYRGQGPAATCTARDRGPAGLIEPACRVSYRSKGAQSVARARATDRAGNTDIDRAVYRVMPAWLAGAPLGIGPEFLVCPGREVTVLSLATSTTRPRLLQPAPRPTVSRRPGPLLRRAGVVPGHGADEGAAFHRYRRVIRLPEDMSAASRWRIRLRYPDSVQRITMRVDAGC